MQSVQGLAGPRWRLGVELRQQRRRVDLQLVDVARGLDCSASKISRVENGKGIPRMPDVVALMQLYGVIDDERRERLTQLVHESREQGWWKRFTDGVQAERFVMNAPARYTALETEAVRVRSFEVAWVHGLLQAPDYSHAVLAELLSARTRRARRRRHCSQHHVDLYEDVLAGMANRALDPDASREIVDRYEFRHAPQEQQMLSILFDFTAVKAVLASVVIVGHILIFVIARRTPARTGPDHPAASARRRMQTVLRAIITAAQLAGAVLTVLEWLHKTGLI